MKAPVGHSITISEDETQMEMEEHLRGSDSDADEQVNQQLVSTTRIGMSDSEHASPQLHQQSLLMHNPMVCCPQGLSIVFVGHYLTYVPQVVTPKISWHKLPP